MKILYFLLIPFVLFAQTRVFYENFEDQAISAPYGHFYGPTGVVLGNWITAYEGTHFSFDSTGRGGGYCLSDIGQDDVDPHIVWYQDGGWSSDEGYVSFWQKFAYANLLSYPNIKTFYPHFGNSSAHGYVHFAMADNETFYYSAADYNSTMLETNVYIKCYGMIDGNWHHYEFYLKFSTGEVKFWYDGELKLSKNYADGCWDGNVYYWTAYKEDASGGTTGTDYFTRQLDDWEVWTGMPTGGDETPPNATVTLTKVSSTSIKYDISNISADIDTLKVTTGATTLRDIKNTATDWDTTLAGLSAGYNVFNTRMVDDSSNVTTRSDSMALGVAKVATMISLIKVVP